MSTRDGLIGGMALLWATCAGAAAWSSGPIDLPIPDHDVVGLSHSIVVEEMIALTDLTVVTAIDHTWLGDLTLRLEHPSGLVVTLMERSGVPPSVTLGYPTDLSMDYPLRFNDAFERPANEAGEGCVGAFDIVGIDCPTELKPEEPLLEAFGGLPTGGTWTLTITDTTFLEIGALGWWSLEIGGALLDIDADGITDAEDNCTHVPNVDQRDTNGDGYGNACDADLNNDDVINFLDLGQMKLLFFSADPDADLDGDGTVNFTDLGKMKQRFYSPPGPSGIAP